VGARLDSITTEIQVRDLEAQRQAWAGSVNNGRPTEAADR
jgi:hypothetical protein